VVLWEVVYDPASHLAAKQPSNLGPRTVLGQTLVDEPLQQIRDAIRHDPTFLLSFSAAGSRPSTLAANTFCAAERAWCRVTCPYGPMVYLRNFAPAPPAGKERHFVAAPHKLFGQVRNDPLSAAIETRRNALNQRSDLGDFHNY
jgi:hypothetical protein